MPTSKVVLLSDFQLHLGAGTPWFGAEHRIISIIGSGPDAFLWVGNSDQEDGACFGILDGVKLSELRDAITKAIRKG